MLNKWKLFPIFVRNYTKIKPKKWKQEAIKYDHVSYYPRHPDHEDPPITPSKLLMVTREKSLRGHPHWDKKIIKLLGISDKGREPVILKNTPEICVLLWKVKHLVKITPIKLPNKLPNADDFGSSYLHENGTLYVFPKVDPMRVEGSENFENNPKKLESRKIGEKLRLLWLSGTLP